MWRVNGQTRGDKDKCIHVDVYVFYEAFESASLSPSLCVFACLSICVFFFLVRVLNVFFYFSTNVITYLRHQRIYVYIVYGAAQDEEEAKIMES